MHSNITLHASLNGANRTIWRPPLRIDLGLHGQLFASCDLEGCGVGQEHVRYARLSCRLSPANRP
jgi:hypothetical protein